MALKDQLFPALYKGIPFLVNRVSTSGGRKDVLNEYPNSDLQNVEDLGLSPRVYRISAIISEPFYITKRDALLRVLEEGGTGVLVHPFYGIINNIAARSFTLNEDVTRLGDTTIECVFAPSTTDGLPTPLSNTISLILQLKDLVFGNIVSDIKAFYRVNRKFSGNFQSSSVKLTEISDSITTNVKSLTATPDQINAFASIVDTFDRAIPQLVEDPDTLAESLQEIFGDIPPLYATPRDQVVVLSLFFPFGDGDPVIDPTTAGLTERKQNLSILNNAVKCFSLAEAYSSAAQIDFTTVSEIVTTADSLEVVFESIKTASSLGDGSLSSTTLDSLEDLRTTTQGLFDKEKLTAKQIITVQTQELPAAIIAFQYYEDSSRGQEIALLNNEINISNMKGNIDILTA